MEAWSFLHNLSKRNYSNTLSWGITAWTKINPERDFQPFNDEKISHLQTKVSWCKTTCNQRKINQIKTNITKTYIMCHQFSVISTKMKYLFSFLSKHKSITKNKNQWKIDSWKHQQNILIGAPNILTIKQTKILIRFDVNE